MNESRMLEVDKRTVEVTATALTPLRAVLDEVVEANSFGEACGVGECGACTVLIDGHSVLSCLVPVGVVEGRSITTIAGLTDGDPVVEAIIASNAFQCAACTPGFVMATHELLRLGIDPGDDDAITAGLAGNLCRCGSYGPIVEAVRVALAASVATTGERTEDGVDG